MTRLALVPTLLALAATPAVAELASPALPPPGVVDGKTGHEIARAGARIVDVRTPEEFAAGHVPGALNIPYDQIARRASEIGPKDTKVLVYCRTGHRSGIAAATLRALGYTQLWDMQRYEAWAAASP